MQTMPAFVYLLPVVLFFGIARVPSAVATSITSSPGNSSRQTLSCRLLTASEVLGGICVRLCAVAGTPESQFQAATAQSTAIAGIKRRVSGSSCDWRTATTRSPGCTAHPGHFTFRLKRRSAPPRLSAAYSAPSVPFRTRIAFYATIFPTFLAATWRSAARTYRL